MLRLRVTDLMGEMTPYELSKRSGGRISMSTAYRLADKKSQLKSFSALLDIFKVPMGELFERVPDKKGKGR